MIDQPSKENTSQARITIGILFLVSLGLALLVKVSRLGMSWPVADSVLWNALPSYCFVFGLCLMGLFYKPHIEKKSYGKLCLSITVGALVYEIEQIWLEGRAFDPYDLAAIFLGSLSAWYVYGRIRSNEEKSEIEEA